MLKQTIFIINFNSLYKILDEIKENLSFKFKKYENEDDFIRDLDSDIINSLIISKSNKKLLLNKYINEKNLLNFNNFPLPLHKLIE